MPNKYANKYCDSCLNIAYDNVGYDKGNPEFQEEFLDQFSGMSMMEDHQCDRIETDGEIPCKCKDHK